MSVVSSTAALDLLTGSALQHEPLAGVPYAYLCPDQNHSVKLAGQDADLQSRLSLLNCTRGYPAKHDGLKVIFHRDEWSPEVIQRIIMLIAIMIFTLIGNTVIIVVLTCSRYRKLHRRVNIFIVNLAVGDLTVCCFTMSTEVLFVVFEEAWVLGGVACKLLLYVQIITLASTTFILTAMSFDRYMAICRPLSIGAGNSRARRMIAISWLMALLFACPQLFIFKQVPVGIYPDGDIKYKCQSKGYTAWWQRKLYFTFMTTYILVVPAVLISFCYINVVRIVWQQGKEVTDKSGIALRKSVGNKSAIPKAKIKTIKMTLSIICSFIVCWTPYFVVHLIHIWSEYQYDIHPAVLVLAEVMALSNSALNPILYGCFNMKVKRGLLEVCCPSRIQDGLSSSGSHKKTVNEFVSMAKDHSCVKMARGFPTPCLHDHSSGSSSSSHHVDCTSAGGCGSSGGCSTGSGGGGGVGIGGGGGCRQDTRLKPKETTIIKEENKNGIKLRVRFVAEDKAHNHPQGRSLLSAHVCDSDRDESDIDTAVL